MDIKKLKKVGSTHVGEWVKQIPIRGLEDLELKVRASDNVDAITLRNNLIRELGLVNEKALEAGDEEAIRLPTDEEARAIETKVLVETIVVDWNITAGKESVPFSKEALTELLTDPEAGTLMMEACSFASRVVVARALRDLESAEKNSDTP